MALAACLTGAAAWRRGWRLGAPVAAAVVPLLVGWDPLLPRPVSHTTLASVLALVGAALLGGELARDREQDAAVRARSMAAQPAGSRRSSPAPDTRRVPAADGAPFDGTLEQELIERYLMELRDALGAESAVYWSLRGGEEITAVASSLGGALVPSIHTNPSVESLVHWAVQQGMPASNYDTDDAFFLTAHVGTPERPHGAVGLFASDRRLIARDRARVFLPRYAARLGAMLDLLQDGRETRRYRGKAEALARAAERIQASTDLTSLGTAICESTLEVSGGTRAAFVLWREKEDAGRVVSVSTGHAIPEDFVVAADSLVGTACRERTRFTIREAYRMSDFPLFAPGEPGRRVNSIAVVPLQRDSRALGAIVVEGDEEAQLTSVEASLLMLVASVSAAALRSVEEFQTVREQSKTDGLTGLPNRRAFDDRLRHHLAECDRRGQVLSLIVADVDNFKQVNDQYGHAAGDAVLVAVARALEHAVRNIDFCARYGGEELVVLLPQTPLALARDVAERLRRTVESLEIVSAGQRLSVTMSFGVACYPGSTRTADHLFAAADRALYDAKNDGRNCVRSIGATVTAKST